MTITNISNTKSYTGTGATTDFSTVFSFFETSEVVVKVDGSLKVENVDYTVTGGDGLIGSVVFVVAPANATLVTLERVVPYSQETDFANFDGNPADVTEKQLDKIVMQTQQLSNFIDRSIRVPEGTTGFDNEITLTGNGSKYLQLKSDLSGLDFATVLDASTVTITSFGESLLDDSTSAEARATLGIGNNVVTLTSSSNAVSIDLSAARTFKHVFTEDTTFTFANADAAGFETSFIIYLENDATGRVPTWPASVIWDAGVEPDVTTINEKNVMAFSSIDGGTIWYGSLAIGAAS